MRTLLMAWDAPVNPIVGAVFAFVLIAVVFAVWSLATTRGPAVAERDKERDNSQRWARAKRASIRPLVVPDDGRLSDRAVIGRLDGEVIAMPPRESVMVIGPTRMGKTARLVGPIVLSWNGAAVITGVKSDIVDLTIAHRKRQGPAWVFDPTGSTGYPACRWSPLVGATTYGGAQRAAAWVTESSRISKDTSGDQADWDSLGQKLIAPLLFAARARGLDMGEIAAWVRHRETEEVDAILLDLGDPDAIGDFASIKYLHDRTKSSIFITAHKILHTFTHADVRAALSAEPGPDLFDPEALLDAGGTLYIVAPEDEQELFRPVFEMLLQSVYKTASDRATSTKRPISPSLLLMLEECANIAPPRNLPKIASAGAGKGVQLVSIWQDLAQIDTIYGREGGRTVRSNHLAKVILPGVTDEDTLDWASKLVGPDRFRRESTSRGAGGASQSVSWVDEPLAPPDYVRRLLTGTSLAIVTNLDPMKLQQPAWWESKVLAERVPLEVREAFRQAYATEEERVAAL